MTRKRLNEIMKKYCIVECEVEDAIDFVSELLHCRAREVEENEPYATKTIADLDRAAYEAFDLIDYVKNLKEE